MTTPAGTTDSSATDPENPMVEAEDGLVIRAVLFDFGGVFTPSPFDAIVTACEALGLDPAVGTAIVFGSYEQDTDHPWHRVERGEIDLITYRDSVREQSQAHGVDLDPMQVLVGMGLAGEGDAIRADVVAVVRQVRASGRVTALVTNNARELAGLWRPLLPLDELFDLVVDSSMVGMRKPDPRIYHHTLDALGGIPPHAAAFLDDAPGNVAAARDLGLHAIQVDTDHTPALDELRGLLALGTPDRG